MTGFDITGWLLVFTRVSGLLAMFPIFSSRNIPVQLRLALGALTAFLVAPSLPPFSTAHLGLFGVVLVLLQELAAGLLLGFTGRLIFFTTDVAGSIISQEMGLNSAALMNPFSDSRSDIPSLILFYLASVLFLSMDMHHWLLIGFQKTYVVLPIGATHMSQPLLKEIMSMTSRMFLVALQMAAPLLALSFLLALIFAVLGRAVPQMNVFSESFSIRTMAGLATFGFTLNLMAQHILNWLHQIPEDILRVAAFLGAK